MAPERRCSGDPAAGNPIGLKGGPGLGPSRIPALPIARNRVNRRFHSPLSRNWGGFRRLRPSASTAAGGPGPAQSVWN